DQTKAAPTSGESPGERPSSRRRSRPEEKEQAKWLLQDRLTEAGVDVEVGEPWAPKVVVDCNLVTGQNPASSAPLAVELLKKLG
ncbi:hypothetical protein ACIBAF_30650, partial [Streptomyces sp. NPDC051677]